VGILIAQCTLVLVLRSLRTLHLVHNLIFMLQSDALALKGVCGLSRALCSRVEVPLCVDLQSHPNHVFFPYLKTPKRGLFLHVMPLWMF
jgi:hypothetical protein